MNINHFRGKTEEEAVAAARAALGEGFVNMGVRIVKPKGFFGFLKASEYEITAAVEDEASAISPKSAFQASMNLHEKNNSVNTAKVAHSVDVAANESIDLNTLSKAQPIKQESAPVKRPVQTKPVNSGIISDTEVIEKKLGKLQGLLEQSLSAAEKEAAQKETAQSDTKETEEERQEYRKGGENSEFVRALYKTLLDNEVDEHYVNRLLDDMAKVIKDGSSVDFILSNVYQKMVLNLGKPSVIPTDQKKPYCVFFIGPTGVGKTTTIAKLASEYKLEKGKKIAFLTSDTYRIAATEQLHTYANILDAPMSILYSEGDLKTAVEKHAGYDYLFVDTAGFSHKNDKQREETGRLLESLGDKYEKCVYLVLSATTKYRDLKEICDIYKGISDYSVIFTKLDETNVYGNLYNIRQYTGVPIAYITNGQNVPDDIRVFDPQAIVKKLLGGQ